MNRTNKELHAALQAQKTGERMWTVFCPATHRHIYPVFESIIIDTYATMDTLPALYNQRGGDSIYTYLDGYLQCFTNIKNSAHNHLREHAQYESCVWRCIQQNKTIGRCKATAYVKKIKGIEKVVFFGEHTH